MTSQPSALSFSMYGSHQATTARSEQFGKFANWLDNDSLETLLAKFLKPNLPGRRLRL
ncbi:hypothetical protein [Synechococcus sp. WH 8020]|uniref:hypothetical protein n=2 Tax=unclassified Synechococcus TaxID=2626047 RepID=UPI0012EE65F4|nr:hypothetical protein [Synechococcus sp. WH 8020]